MENQAPKRSKKHQNQAPKRRQKDIDHDDGSDRISQLPEPVLHHILSFLSLKKSLQTCVLSKSWRHLAPTRPVIGIRRTCRDYKYPHVIVRNKFCENCFEGNEETFMPVLHNTFRRYHRQNIYVQELRLEMSQADSQSNSLLQKWIPVFLERDTPVTKFRLSFGVSRTSFDLPSVVFGAESLQLREIHLEGCRLNEINVVLSKNLRKLSLRHVWIDDEALEKIMAGCPLLECVVLEYCKGLSAINIANTNIRHLNHFVLSCCYEENTKTDGSHLQRSIRISRCHINNYFPHLKSLLLSQVKLSTDPFHNFSANFPCLQELRILQCPGLEEINISSSSIKRLTIKPERLFKEVAIDAPNILYFELFSYALPTTLSLGTTNSCREWKSHLDLSLVPVYTDVLSTLRNVIEMVKTLSQSQISLKLSKTLFFNIKQIEWDFNDHPVAVEHLVLNINELRPDSLPHLLHAFRIFRPKYINALHGFRKVDEQVTKFLWKTLIHERGERACGWERHLEEVSVEASDEKGRVWHHVQWKCLPEWSENLKIRFRLKWRDLRSVCL